jgi:hypothetical protein
MLIQARTLDSAFITGKKANSDSISFVNIITEPSAWLSSTNDSFAVMAKEY